MNDRAWSSGRGEQHARSRFRARGRHAGRASRGSGGRPASSGRVGQRTDAPDPTRDAFGPCALAFDRLPARRRHDLKSQSRAARPGHRRLQVLRAKSPNRPGRPRSGWDASAHPTAGERRARSVPHRARSVLAVSPVSMPRNRLLLRPPSATSVASYSSQACRRTRFRIASYDLRRAVGSVAHDLDRPGAGAFGLLFELSLVVVDRKPAYPAIAVSRAVTARTA